MTSSGIVLMPFNAVRYSAILGIGLMLFLAGSMFNEVVINHHKLSFKETVKLAVVSLTLAIGVGMISGGISHFKESPVYVSYLIPIGIMVSLISFAIKNNYKLEKKQSVSLIIGVITLAILLHFALGFLGNLLFPDMIPGGDIYKNTH
jgi:branched-subunit amino acid transport protein AzlD